MSAPALTERTFLSPEGLAELLDVPVNTVYQWNRTGYGPDLHKIGRHVRYDVVDVERWLEAQKVKGLA